MKHNHWGLSLGVQSAPDITACPAYTRITSQVHGPTRRARTVIAAKEKQGIEEIILTYDLVTLSAKCIHEDMLAKKQVPETLKPLTFKTWVHRLRKNHGIEALRSKKLKNLIKE